MNKQRHTLTSDFNTEVKLKGFKVYEIDSKTGKGHSYSRKDFYKISLNTGKYIFHYADRSFETDETILFFGNPRIPYSCEVISTINNGYACLFTEDFLKLSERSESLLHSPLFQIGGTPILTINKEQKKELTAIFQKMIAEQDTDYAYKDEIIRNYINLIIHEALKMQPSESYSQQKNAAARITSVFLELLERQFPIESTRQSAGIKSRAGFCEASIRTRQLSEWLSKGGNRKNYYRAYCRPDHQRSKSPSAAYGLEYCRNCLCSWF